MPVATGFKANMDQNNTTAEQILTVVNASGGISEGLICFTAITLVPKKKLPSKTAALALFFSVMVVILLYKKREASEAEFPFLLYTLCLPVNI